MKKKVELSFLITLIILSILGILWKAEFIEHIVSSIILPSFFLSFISFILDIVYKYPENTKRIAESAIENYNLKKEIIGEESVESMNMASIYKRMQFYYGRIQKTANMLMVFGYVFLVVSLVFHTYIGKYLSDVNLNFISLWALLLLYIVLEFKGKCRVKLFRILYYMSKKYVENKMAKERCK